MEHHGTAWLQSSLIYLGAAVLAMWGVSGHLGHLAEHPQTLEESFIATNSGRAEALSFVAPVAYTLDWLMYFSDRNKLLTVGMASVFGAIAGSFTMALAQEVASKGVTVNTVSPGYIGTEMVRAIKPEILEKIVATIPVKRLGQPEEIASIIAWLASEEGGYSTGADFSVNGGLHMG